MSTRTAASPPHSDFFPAPPSPGLTARWRAAIVDDARHLVRFWPVIQNMVVQELRVRYQRSVMGFFWTLLNPILMMVTLTLVFSQLLLRDPSQDWRGYSVYLFAGMVPWSFLAAGLSDCAFCIIQNENLIRKIFLPKLVFPLTRVLIGLVTLVLSMAALFLLLYPMGARLTWPMVLLPVVIVLFTIFTLGLGLIVATLNTFYRDCGHLVSVVLQAWYFTTPIIYQADMLGGKQRWLWCNPAYPLIRLFQVIIRDGQWPDLTLFLVAAGFATASLGIGYAAFKSYEDKLVFRL